MHWTIDDVRQLPTSYYTTLIKMLSEEAQPRETH
jgi:hypothetical protein